MKSSAIMLALLLPIFASSQCSDLSISVSSSTETQVQLYHAGLFLIPNGDQNVCEWEVTTLDGGLVHTATTTGDFEGQSFTTFEHEVPLTDSMQVVLAITNEAEGILCTVTDTLHWELTEILPGSFIGSWTILGEYGGVEEAITSVDDQHDQAVLVFPVPARDRITVSGLNPGVRVRLTNAQGRLLCEKQSIGGTTQFNLRELASGLYFVHVLNTQGEVVLTKRALRE